MKLRGQCQCGFFMFRDTAWTASNGVFVSSSGGYWHYPLTLGVNGTSLTQTILNTGIFISWPVLPSRRHTYFRKLPQGQVSTVFFLKGFSVGSRSLLPFLPLRASPPVLHHISVPLIPSVSLSWTPWELTVMNSLTRHAHWSQSDRNLMGVTNHFLTVHKTCCSKWNLHLATLSGPRTCD